MENTEKLSKAKQLIRGLANSSRTLCVQVALRPTEYRCDRRQ